MPSRMAERLRRRDRACDARRTRQDWQHRRDGESRRPGCGLQGIPALPGVALTRHAPCLRSNTNLIERRSTTSDSTLIISLRIATSAILLASLFSVRALAADNVQQPQGGHESAHATGDRSPSSATSLAADPRNATGRPGTAKGQDQKAKRSTALGFVRLNEWGELVTSDGYRISP